MAMLPASRSLRRSVAQIAQSQGLNLGAELLERGSGHSPNTRPDWRAPGRRVQCKGVEAQTASRVWKEHACPGDMLRHHHRTGACVHVNARHLRQLTEASGQAVTDRHD
eukprot:CAMPEP_0175697080 /NCGR_PEP_ID=MMETSP0097-20121207/33276_1 /TAXON_ID=311494 /ORGANISM="Alexandrium monilatum, Strain CCMP3105" /LENGTH=108 /DNA_ID=CAMNT_0017004245 /DNA_START=160 /DNA_END=483 /DNA_ORIENTATION=+